MQTTTTPTYHRTRRLALPSMTRIALILAALVAALTLTMTQAATAASPSHHGHHAHHASHHKAQARRHHRVLPASQHVASWAGGGVLSGYTWVAPWARQDFVLGSFHQYLR